MAGNGTIPCLLFANPYSLFASSYLRAPAMRLTLLTLCLVGLGWAGAHAQDRKFPYEAVVDLDDEPVRCGPGPKYYPTGKVKRGDKVTVHRHDPGGWSMIAPPAGSFSWIQAEYVQRLASGKGTLTANNVVVHVGSALSDERGVYQRTLSKGDTVEILSEATVTTERGPVTMYKIKPPPREYRWISAKALAPADGSRAPGGKVRAPLDPAPSISGPIALELDDSESDPFAPSPKTDSPEHKPGEGPALPRLGNEPPDSPPLSSAADAPPVHLDGLRKQLEALDVKFRETLRGEPQTWDLASIEQAYKSLDEQANHPAFHSHVQQRLYSLQRYNKVRQDYVDFFQLTSETQKRDAQLLSMQKQHEEQLKALESVGRNPNGIPMASPTPIGAARPESSKGLDARTTPFPEPQGVPPNPAMPVSQPSTPPGASPKFVGAGIVQRLGGNPNGGPAYALVTPDGKLLAYLEPAPGLDLAPAANQALGIQGQRSFREDLKADLIVVRGYQPVTLRTK